MGKPNSRPVVWVGSSLEDLWEFPAAVQRFIGFALRRAQDGGRHLDAKPLRGFGGAGVLEIVEDHDGEAYRVVCTVRFAEAVYVLHVFEKSKKEIATPRHELDLIRARLREAEVLHTEHMREEKSHE